MVHISSLPPEILSCIFGQVDSAAQLAACRLVCRGWNYPAEQAMFGKEIRIHSERQAIQLYGHLCKNPANGRLIKHMDLDIEQTELPPIYEHLMDMAFTPNMEKLSGFTKAHTCFDILTTIAERYSLEFPRSRQIPINPYIDKGDYIYANTMKQLQGSALTLLVPSSNLSSWWGMAMLDGFKNLRYLDLREVIDNWSSVHPILEKCHTLETLKFSYFRVENTTTDKNEVYTWAALHGVNKELSLKAIEFECSNYDAALIEYLMYKYPNVTKFKSLVFLGSAGSYHEWHPILDSLKRVQSKQLSFILSFDTPIWGAIRFAESGDEKVTFHTYWRNVLMKIT